MLQLRAGRQLTGWKVEEWNIYLELDGVLYNTGYMYSQA